MDEQTRILEEVLFQLKEINGKYDKLLVLTKQLANKLEGA